MAWLAALPIATVLAAMLLLRWSAVRAGIAGALVSAAVAPAFGSGDAATLAGVLAEAAFTSATILWILWPALALHEHQQRSGALDRMRQGLSSLSTRRGLQVILVGWFGALFFEGAAGFGTPVALAAPLLVGLGVPAVQAVVLALVGHAVGVSFGALGTPVLAQLSLVDGIDARALSGSIALLHLAAGGVMAFAFHRLLGAAGPVGVDDRMRHSAPPAGGWMALAAAAFLLPSVAFAALVGPELATLGAALLGGLLFAAAIRKAAPAAGDRTRDPALARAFWPYIVLVILVLLTRGIEPVAQALASWTLEWRWQDRFSGRFAVLAHPGTLLFLALLAGAALQRVPPAQLREPLAVAARRLLPVSAALLAMLFLSRLMVHAGMIDAIRAAAVAGLGGAWPAVAPSVGALGSFVTGSATASNVLFTTLQAQTAQSLGLPVAAILAAQGFGAAIGNIVCPHNIVAGAATVGLAGREPEILRQTLLPCAAALAVGGVALWLVLGYMRVAP